MRKIMKNTTVKKLAAAGTMTALMCLFLAVPVFADQPAMGPP